VHISAFNAPQITDSVGQRFIVRADEKLMAFMELEAASRGPDFALTSR